jgi:hypothetical protein
MLTGFRFSVVAASALLTIGSSDIAVGQTVSCNLAPNAAFEQGTATSIDQWGFYANSGAGTFSVSNYPSPVQSGSRAAKVVVTTSGDLYLYSPEPGTIPVFASTAYKLSARLKSDAGKIAGIRIIEWNGSAPQADRFLAFNTGTGDWETVEGGFTTTAQTTTVSIRLNHPVPGAQGTGTFYWDDVMLWRDCASRCADVRHYVGQTTPGYQLCDITNVFCMDAVKTAGGELLRGASNGAVDYLAHTLASRSAISIQKSFASNTWQCFSNRDEACGAARTSPGQNAQFAPQSLPISMSLPVLLSPGTSQRTVGAAAVHDWQEFVPRAFDPATGLSGASAGSIFHRTWAYLLSSYNFGGNIGLQSNVLVIEAESIGGPTCREGLGGGTRLERYMYIRGLGLAYAEGRTNPACVAAPSVATCTGIYTQPDPNGSLTLANRNSGDLAIANNAPGSFDVVDWW